jgi:phosphoglycerate dehydrogenase-like enzyme
MVHVWLPYADVDEAARRLGGLPAGLEVDCFTGDDLPGSADEVELVVLPYMRPGGARVLRELPSLTTVQTLTAGVDDVLPHLGPDITLCNAAGVHDASTAELALALILASAGTSTCTPASRNAVSGTPCPARRWPTCAC